MKKRMLSVLLALVMCISLLPTAAFAAIPFNDVDNNEWYFDSVVYVYEKGLMTGVSNNAFSPNSNLTRAQLCQILYNMERQPAVTGDSFADVVSSDWYFKAVNWVADNNIANGVGEGLFSPNTEISREQTVTILYNYSVFKGYEVDDVVSLTDFVDANSVSSWAETSMKWAISDGIITGITTETLVPKGTTSRSQAATILMRYCTRVDALIAFREKDVDDFEDFTVIKFEDSDETNFAVLSAEAIVDTGLATNNLVNYDVSTGTFVFENIDDSIRGLKPGDIFYSIFGTGKDDYILLMVGSININGSTATITETEANLSDFFEYIDVDMDVELNADFMDFSDMDKELTYEGTEASLSGTSHLLGTIGGSESFTLNFGIKGDSVSATAGVKLTFTLKVMSTASCVWVLSTSYLFTQGMLN